VAPVRSSPEERARESSSPGCRPPTPAAAYPSGLAGPLTERPAAHLDAGYDCTPCRQVLAVRGMVGIAVRAMPAPVQAGRRWVIERTRARGNQYRKLRWRSQRVRAGAGRPRSTARASPRRRTCAGAPTRPWPATGSTAGWGGSASWTTAPPRRGRTWPGPVIDSRRRSRSTTRSSRRPMPRRCWPARSPTTSAPGCCTPWRGSWAGRCGVGRSRTCGGSRMPVLVVTHGGAARARRCRVRATHPDGLLKPLSGSADRRGADRSGCWVRSTGEGLACPAPRTAPC
jgi:hypothetical protein